MNFAKKLFAAGASVAMALTAVPVAFAAAHSVGQNISSTDGTVWMVYQGTSGVCRRAYTSAGAFLSYGFNSWSQVVAANSDDLALAVCSEGFIPPQDGSVIFSDRGADKGTGYILSGSMKYGFPTEAIFKGQGYNYATAMWADISWVGMGGVINSADAAHLPGSLVNNAGTVQLVGNSGLMGIPDLATFNSWGYSFAKVEPANANDKAKAQTGVMATRLAGQLSPTATTNLPPTNSGPLSAMVASDNPAVGTLVAGQGLADLAHFAFSGSGTLTNVVIERIGVSANTTPANVYLFDGSTRLTDSASFGSDNKLTFAGQNIAISGSRVISVKADIASSTSGQTVGVRLTSYTASGSSASTVSLSGNIHNIATATLATVALSSATGSGNSDPGKDLLVWQGTVTVGTRDVTLNRLSLRQVGSIVNSDINNFRLMIDGTQIAQSQSVDSSGYVTFAVNTTVKTGSRTFKVMADVIGGSGRTVQLSLRGAYDISTTDSSYGATVLATGTFPFGPSSFTVNAGALTVAKAANSQSQNVVAGASDVSVGTWTFTAYGEPIKVETLTVGVDTNGTDASNSFRNVRILVDGSQVGSTTSVAGVNSYATGTSFTTNFTVTPGTPRTVEVRSDMVDDTSTDLIANGTTTTAQFALVAGSSNATPQVSLSMIGVPTASVPANSLTITTGSISIAATTNYASQSIVVPQTAFKVGSFTITGNSTEAINVNTFTLNFTIADTDTSGSLTTADITDVYLKYGAAQTAVKPTVAATSSTTSNSNTWSPSFTLGVNESVTVDVYASLSADFTATDTILSSLLVSGTTAQSGQSKSTNSGSVLAGQTMTVAAGTVTATTDASRPNATLVDDSGTVTTDAIKFHAVTDSYTVTDLTLTLGDVTAVSSVILKDGSTTLATHPGSSLTFSGLSIPVTPNADKVITVQLVMSTIGVGAGTSDVSLLTTLTSFTARSSNGTTDVSANDSGPSIENNPAGQAMYAYKAIPTITQVALPNSDLAAGTNVTIAKFSINTNGTGTIAWKQIMLEISKTTTPTVASPTLYRDGTQVTGVTMTFQNGDSSAATCNGSNVSCEMLITIDSDASGSPADDDTVESLNGGATYEVRATIGGSIAATDSVSVKFDRNTTSHAAKAAYTSADNSTSANSVSFTWSDESASATGDTGVSTWISDYLVNNLPMSWNMN